MNETFPYILIAVLFGIILGTIIVSAYCLIDSIRSKIKIFIIPLTLATIGSIALFVYYLLDFIRLVRG